MTETALAQGMGLLFLMWPHRAESSATVGALRSLYREAMGELSDAAWLAACRSAIRTCTHFPVPAELIALAESAAEDAYRHRIMAEAQPRPYLLPSGEISEEQAAANRERLAQMTAETLAAIRHGGEQATRQPGEYWRSPRPRRHRVAPPAGQDGAA